MLKVLKYDWKNGWNNVRLTLIAAAVVSALFGLGMGLVGGRATVIQNTISVVGDNTMDNVVMIMSVTWICVMLALMVLTIDAIIRNMGSRMFGAEGSLTQTLPVETWELLLGKVLGTWLFGVFMVFVAFASVIIALLMTAIASGEVMELLRKAGKLLSELEPSLLKTVLKGIGLFLYGGALFLLASFLLMIQFQFITIAARQFGRFHVPAGFGIFWLLTVLEGGRIRSEFSGFLVVTVFSVFCFAGSHWLMKHRLNI